MFFNSVGTIPSLFQFPHYYQFFLNLLSFVISAIPNILPRPILSLFLLKVLQADKLANESSRTLFQALRCLKTYFLMVPVALVLWVVRFQYKQSD